MNSRVAFRSTESSPGWVVTGCIPPAMSKTETGCCGTWRGAGRKIWNSDFRLQGMSAQGFEKPGWPHVEGAGQGHDVEQCEVTLAPVDTPDIVAMEVG